MSLVSVIIVTKDRPEWLREAVASVVAQTFDSWKCMVVFNSTVPSGDEIHNMQRDRRVFIGINSGDRTNIGNARNHGARSMTQCEYYLFLDDDDTLIPDALEALMHPLQHQPGLVGSYGLPVLLDAAGNRISETINNRPPGPLLHLSDLAGNINMVTPPGCALIRRSAFEATGGWDESGQVRESVELFFRLLKQGSMACVPQSVIGYRQHPGQLSRVRNQDRGQWDRTQAKLQECLQEVYDK